MSPKISVYLISYGGLLLTLGLLGVGLQLPLTKTALFTGIAGGILCLLWGALARLGHSYRGWTILTLGAISYTLLAQAVFAWLEPTDQGTHLIPVFKTVGLFGALTLITYLLHFDQSPPKPVSRTPQKQETSVQQPEIHPSRKAGREVTMYEVRK